MAFVSQLKLWRNDVLRLWGWCSMASSSSGSGFCRRKKVQESKIQRRIDSRGWRFTRRRPNLCDWFVWSFILEKKNLRKASNQPETLFFQQRKKALDLQFHLFQMFPAVRANRWQRKQLKMNSVPKTIATALRWRLTTTLGHCGWYVCLQHKRHTCVVFALAASLSMNVKLFCRPQTDTSS